MESSLGTPPREVAWPGAAPHFRGSQACTLLCLELLAGKVSPAGVCTMQGAGAGEQEGWGSWSVANRIPRGEGAGHSPRTSEALMALKGQKYPTGRGRGNGRDRCRRGGLGVCLSAGTDAWHHLTPCGSPFGMGFLGTELLFGAFYGKRMEKGKNKEMRKLIEIHSVGHAYTQTYIQTHADTHTHTHTYTYTHTHTYTHASHKHAPTHIYTYVYTRTHTETQTHAHAYTHIHIYAHIHTQRQTLYQKQKSRRIKRNSQGYSTGPLGESSHAAGPGRSHAGAGVGGRGGGEHETWGRLGPHLSPRGQPGCSLSPGWPHTQQTSQDRGSVGWCCPVQVR